MESGESSGLLYGAGGIIDNLATLLLCNLTFRRAEYWNGEDRMNDPGAHARREIALIANDVLKPKHLHRIYDALNLRLRSQPAHSYDETKIETRSHS